MIYGRFWWTVAYYVTEIRSVWRKFEIIIKSIDWIERTEAEEKEDVVLIVLKEGENVINLLTVRTLITVFVVNLSTYKRAFHQNTL